MLVSVLLLLKSLPEVVPWTFLLVTAPSFFAVWLPFRVVSIVLPSRTFGTVDDFTWGCYQRLVLCFFEKLCPVEVHFYGDVDEIFGRKESVLYMSNHQSTVDWIVADMLAVRQGSLGQMRYVLKDGLRFLPLYGYYFFQHDCIYVRRSRKFNVKIMERNLRDLIKRRQRTWLVIFPEGTRYNPEKSDVIAHSKNFAKQNGLAPLQSVLAPRSKAFYVSHTALRTYFDAVYDVTILYSHSRVNGPNGDAIRVAAPTMNDYVHGKGEKVHIIVKRTAMDDVPPDERGTQEWLHQRFQQKDELIENYYRDGQLPGSSKQVELSWSEIAPPSLFFLGLNVVFLGTEIGRKVYLTSALCGTIFTVGWMAVRKVA